MVWIPKLKIAERVPKQYKLKSTLDLQFIEEKSGKSRKTYLYFKVLNPLGLNSVKEDIDDKKLQIDELYLPFWSNDNNDIIISFNKANLGSLVKADELVAEQIYKGDATYRSYASAGRGNKDNADKTMSRGYIAVLNAIA